MMPAFGFNTPTLCIFANFFIDNEERLQRMIDSFNSFRDVNPHEWRINIRGSLRHHAADFLARELGDSLHLHFLESSKGWFFDSHSFMIYVQSDYILFWIEDHICIQNPGRLNDVLVEMRCYSVDLLWYSWLNSRTLSVFKRLPAIAEGHHIHVSLVDPTSSSNVRRQLARDFYVVSCVSILEKTFFLSVLTSNKPILKRWPQNLPFDFEKTSRDLGSAAIIWGLPRRELFVAIDDDLETMGYSLISRGLYPNRISRYDLKLIESGTNAYPYRFFSRRSSWIEKVLIGHFHDRLLRIQVSVSSFLWRVSCGDWKWLSLRFKAGHQANTDSL